MATATCPNSERHLDLTAEESKDHATDSSIILQLSFARLSINSSNIRSRADQLLSPMKLTAQGQLRLTLRL